MLTSSANAAERRLGGAPAAPRLTRLAVADRRLRRERGAVGCVSPALLPGRLRDLCHLPLALGTGACAGLPVPGAPQ